MYKLYKSLTLSLFLLNISFISFSTNSYGDDLYINEMQNKDKKISDYDFRLLYQKASQPVGAIEVINYLETNFSYLQNENLYELLYLLSRNNEKDMIKLSEILSENFEKNSAYTNSILLKILIDNFNLNSVNLNTYILKILQSNKYKDVIFDPNNLSDDYKNKVFNILISKNTNKYNQFLTLNILKNYNILSSDLKKQLFVVSNKTIYDFNDIQYMNNQQKANYIEENKTRRTPFSYEIRSNLDKLAKDEKDKFIDNLSEDEQNKLLLIDYALDNYENISDKLRKIVLGMNYNKNQYDGGIINKLIKNYYHYPNEIKNLTLTLAKNNINNSYTINPIIENYNNLPPELQNILPDLIKDKNAIKIGINTLIKEYNRLPDKIKTIILKIDNTDSKKELFSSISGYYNKLPEKLQNILSKNVQNENSVNSVVEALKYSNGLIPENVFNNLLLESFSKKNIKMNLLGEALINNYSILTKNNKDNLEKIIRNDKFNSKFAYQILSMYSDVSEEEEFKIPPKLENILMNLLNKKSSEQGIKKAIDENYWYFPEKIKQFINKQEKFSSEVIYKLLTYKEDDLGKLSEENKKIILKLADKENTITSVIKGLSEALTYLPDDLSKELIKKIDKKKNLNIILENMDSEVKDSFMEIVREKPEIMPLSLRISVISDMDLSNENINIILKSLHDLTQKDKQELVKGYINKESKYNLMAIMIEHYSELDSDISRYILEDTVNNLDQQDEDNIRVLALVINNNFISIPDSLKMKALRFFTETEELKFMTPVILEKNYKNIKSNLLNDSITSYISDINETIIDDSDATDNDENIAYIKSYAMVSIGDNINPNNLFTEQFSIYQDESNKYILSSALKNFDKLTQKNKGLVLSILNKPNGFRNYYNYVIENIDKLPDLYIEKIISLSKKSKYTFIGMITPILSNYSKQPEAIKKLIFENKNNSDYVLSYLSLIISNYSNLPTEVRNIVFDYSKNLKNHAYLVLFLTNTKDIGFQNDKKKILLDVISENKISEYIIWALMSEYKLIPLEAKNKLKELVNDKNMVRNIARSIVYNYQIIDSETADYLLQKISNSGVADDFLGLTLKHNFKLINPSFRNSLLDNLEKRNIDNDLLIADIITENYSALDDKLKDKLIDLSKNKVSADYTAKAIYNNYSLLPPEVSSTILLNIMKTEPLSKNLIKTVAANYYDMNQQLKNVLENKEIEHNFLMSEIFENYSKLPIQLQEKFDLALLDEKYTWDGGKLLGEPSRRVVDGAIGMKKDLRHIFYKNKLLISRIEKVVNNNKNLSENEKKNLNNLNEFYGERLVTYLFLLEFYNDLPEDLRDEQMKFIADENNKDEQFTFKISKDLFEKFKLLDMSEKTKLLKMAKEYSLPLIYWVSKEEIEPFKAEIIDSYLNNKGLKLFNEFYNINLIDFANTSLKLRNNLLVDYFTKLEKDSEYTSQQGNEYNYNFYYKLLTDRNF